ncbi:hypothetical protein BDZ91DRAFT_781013 [Kalaharituber pfeilii]|nr:hypothetical protein BDZ91DRAFT_781013 [Kalaharituber pfeilii]
MKGRAYPLSSKLLLLGILFVVGAIIEVVHARPQRIPQTPLGLEGDTGKVKVKKRKLHGRFLHITDLHPDNYYTPQASPSNACHVRLPETDPDASVLKKPKGPDDEPNDPPSGDPETVGLYGAPATNCDSPHTLINATFDWIKNNLMNPDDDSMGIDFVIWTGDSARHDNDVQRPRTEKEILSLNQMMIDKMLEVFGNKDGLDDEDPTNDLIIPVVPTLGNNDILPHNIFLPGPNTLTREYLSLWKSFIPEDQYHIFDRGAYFWKDVVPGNKKGENDQLEHGGLAVVSLNTMYFFASNSAVDGCDLPSEPGYQQFEWLRVQLDLMRQTGMKALVIGHVPPARVREVGWKEGGREDWETGWGKRSWDETCWRKFVLWSKQYRDVLVGSMFGHMNLDHFLIMDTNELERKHPRQNTGNGDNGEQDVFYTDKAIDGDPAYKINSAEDYLISLREGFARLPSPHPPKSEEGKDPRDDLYWKKRYIEKIGGEYGERFIVNWVGPSVVPNYFPTLRIVEYNITGIAGAQSEGEADEGQIDTEIDNSQEMHIQDELKKRNAEPSKKKEPHSPKKPKKPDNNVPKPPSPTAPPGPAYSNQPFTLLGYKQLYANLSRINLGRGPQSSSADSVDNEFRYELEYDTRNDKHYSLKDMTVRSYLNLAHKLVDARKPNRNGKKNGKGKGNKENAKGNGDKEDDITAFEDLDIDMEVYEEQFTSESLSPSRSGRLHKGHQHQKGNKQRDRIFREFLNRAFVQTIDMEDLNQLLGIRPRVLDRIDDGDMDEHQQPTPVKVTAMGVGRERPLEFMQGFCREGEKTFEDEVEIMFRIEKERWRTAQRNAENVEAEGEV